MTTKKGKRQPNMCKSPQWRGNEISNVIKEYSSNSKQDRPHYSLSFVGRYNVAEGSVKLISYMMNINDI